MRTSRHFLEGKRIIVAGGGISGSAFVAALTALWDPALQPPDVLVFDRDARNAEGRWYSISLLGDSADGGMATLQRLGVLDEAMARSTLGAKPRPKGFTVWDANWKELLSLKTQPWGDLPTGSMRIERADLREILIRCAESSFAKYQWEAACVDAERLSGGQTRVTVAQGTGRISVHDCDILIVADGARSTIRERLRPGDTLQYAGAVQIGGKATFPGGIPRPVESRGLTFSGQGVCCFFDVVDSETVLWALSQDKSQSKAAHVVASKLEALRLGRMFAEPFKTIVEATKEETLFVVQAEERQPLRHQDRQAEGIVYIGDADHAISPFGGIGANLGLKDGWDLAESLCLAGSLSAAVSAYDSVSFPRAANALNTSHLRIEFAHCTSFKSSLIRAGLATGRLLLRLKGL